MCGQAVPAQRGRLLRPSEEESPVSLLVILTVQIRPGMGDAYVDSMQALIAEERASAGVEQFELFRSPEEQDRFVLFERFADDAAYARHRERMAARGAAGQELRAGPPQREQFSTAAG